MKILLEDAARALEEDAMLRRNEFGKDLAAISNKYGCKLEATITLPGGETVALSSFLETLGIKAQAGLRIILR